MGGKLAKVGFVILLLVCENFILTMYLTLFFIFIYFTHMVRLRISLMWMEAQIQKFIQEKILKPNFHPVEFVDALFPVYNQEKGGHQNTPSLLST